MRPMPEKPPITLEGILRSFSATPRIKVDAEVAKVKNRRTAKKAAVKRMKKK